MRDHQRNPASGSTSTGLESNAITFDISTVTMHEPSLDVAAEIIPLECRFSLAKKEVHHSKIQNVIVTAQLTAFKHLN